MPVDLIYDIGANNGDDSAFYLAKGFRVVAIEADPQLCAALQQRFAPEIADGRLTIENIGVSNGEDVLDFYVNNFSEWSSFVKAGKATTELDHLRIQVRTEPLARVIERHGAARYLKIDIEGMEKPALSTLHAGLALPTFLSFEVNNDWRPILRMLATLGYDSYQLVRQGMGFLPDPPQSAREGQYVAQIFRNSQSGCFGQELPGAWLSGETFDQLMKDEIARAKARLDRGERRGWHDIHCQLS